MGVEKFLAPWRLARMSRAAPRRGGAPSLWQDEPAEAEAAEAAAVKLQLLIAAVIWMRASLIC